MEATHCMKGKTSVQTSANAKGDLILLSLKNLHGLSKATLSCSSQLHVRPQCKGVCHWWQHIWRSLAPPDHRIFFPTANKRPRQIYWCEHSSWKGRKQKQKTKTSEGSGSKTWIFTNEITFLKILLLLFLRKHSTSLPQGYGQPLRDCSCSGRCHHLLCYNQKRNAPNCPTYYSFIYTRSTIRIIWNDTSLWCFL